MRAALRPLAVAALASGVAATSAGAAQEPAPPPPAPLTPAPADSLQLVDRIVAIVGDTVILRSEIFQEFLRLRTQGAAVPEEGSEEWLRLSRQIISAATDRLILLQQAKRAGLLIGADEVDAESERRYQEVRRNFLSDAEMQAEVERSGMNMFQYRQMLRADAQADLLIDMHRRSLAASGELPAVVVTEEEIREVFQQYADSQERPATVSFNQLIVQPLPAQPAADSAMARARQALREVSEGEEFEIVARRYSEDPGTRERGGELGWLRRGDVVKAFGDAAWSARPGSTVGPVITRFGIHLIRIENVRGGERFLRHLLIRPEITPADVAEAGRLAAELADSLRAGVDPERLARSPAVADEEIRFDDVLVDRLQQFGAPYVERLASPTPGTVLEPFPLLRGGATEYVVVQVLDYRSSGRYDLEEVREFIRDQLRSQKQLDGYLERLRRDTYIEVRI